MCRLFNCFNIIYIFNFTYENRLTFTKKYYLFYILMFNLSEHFYFEFLLHILSILVLQELSLACPSITK